MREDASSPKHLLENGPPCMSSKGRVGGFQCLSEDRLGAVEFTAHSPPLGSHSREDEDGIVLRPGPVPEDQCGVGMADSQSLQGRARRVPVGCDDGGPVAQEVPMTRQSVSDVWQIIETAGSGHRFLEIQGPLRQRAPSFGRQKEERGAHIRTRMFRAMILQRGQRIGHRRPVSAQHRVGI